MKNIGTILLSLCGLFLLGELSVIGQTVMGSTSFDSMSRHEIEILIADVAKTNPSVIQKLGDPEFKKKQIKDLKELLACASQARKDGLASDLVNQQEMENIRIETIAGSYDREINTGKPAKPLLGYINDDSIRKFWSEADREPEFQ